VRMTPAQDDFGAVLRPDFSKHDASADEEGL